MDLQAKSFCGIGSVVRGAQEEMVGPPREGLAAAHSNASLQHGTYFAFKAERAPA